MLARLTLIAALALALALAAPARPAAAATPNQNFVSQAYLDILNRPVDPPSLNTYTTLLNSNSITPTGFAQTLLASDEYRALVAKADYSLLLHRAPLSAELSTAITSLTSGTDEQLAANLSGNAEYFALHGSTNDTWLDGVFADFLNRPLSSGDRSTFDTLLTVDTRPQVAAIILTSPEYRTDLVSGYFTKYLHRAADTPGLNTFITELSSVPDETVIAQMIGSPEYFQNAQSTPEPATLSLLSAATLLLLFHRRRA